MKTPLLKHLFFLLLMLLGCSGAWGQAPVEITTDANENSIIDEGEKKLYLIQTNAFPSFYIVPQSDNTITTNNILGDYMLWYFLDAGNVDGVQYYYLVNNSTGKYVYNHEGRLISLVSSTDFASLTDANKEKCKFKLVVDNTNGTTDFYNIDVKATQTYYGLNKQNGSQTNNNNPIRLTNNQYIHDTNSKWKFISYSGTFTWPAPPFTVSTGSDKHYYKIRNEQNKDYYVSTDATPDKVTFSTTESNNMAWYFKEAGSDSWNKYYYIVNPHSGDKYMYYSGTATDGSDQTNAVCVKAYDSANEDRYQFIVLQAARGDGNSRVLCYVIIPKLLRENYWSSNGIGPKTISNGSNMGIINSRGANNDAHWTFVATTYPLVCAAPTITYSTATGKITLASTTPGNTIYYTIDGETTPSSDDGTKYTSPFAVPEASGTTIKAITTKEGFNDSEVTVVRVVTEPTFTLTPPEGGYDYDGNAKEPAVTVKDGETTISENEYDVAYSNNINAGTTATITITDKVGGDYIVYGSKTFTINKATITPTVTVDDWEWNTSASTPVITDNLDNEAVTYKYKVRGAADDTYGNDVPTNVGEYTLRATFAETANCYGATATADFKITPKSIGDGVRALDGFLITMEKDAGDYVVTVKDGETTLTEGEHYTVAVEGDLVTVAGTGNYTGSAKFVSANAKFERPAGVSGEYAAAYNSGMDIYPSYVVTPYVVKRVNASIGTVTITRLDYIPEGVPVLLLAESALTGFTASPISESTDPISPALLSSNLLKVAPMGGVDVETTEAYLFYKGEFVLTFAGTISAGSFFLYNPNYTAAPGAPSPRRYLRIEKEEDDATAMDDGQWGVDNGQWTQHDEIYDLCGRRVKGQLTKGIYIVNGQKRLIK